MGKVLEAIVKELLRYKEDVRDNIQFRVTETERYKKIQAIPADDLPLYINKYPEDTVEEFLYDCRLKNEDPFKVNFCFCSQLLWDETFDTEAYRNIGYNDGLSPLTATLLRIAGYTKEANEALEATYRDD